MKLNCGGFLFLVFLIISAPKVSAQDSSLIQAAASSALAFYYNYIGEEAHLYDGSEHAPYDFRIKGHPYFETNLLQKGSVNYNDIAYSSIDLAYDIVRDELTTNRYKNNFRMSLFNDKIKSFSITGHFFVRIVQDTIQKSPLETGFYELLYDGKMKAYAKRRKIINEKVTADEGDRLWFEETDSYYVKRDEKFYRIKEKKDLFTLFKSQKKDLRKYLRKNKIRYKEQPGMTIIKSIEYIDHSIK
ncbi:MAG TPA: hypothetical protein VKR32_07790 [Puia sp.]|nr:hypothetical protein [Puia sp.]